MMNDGTMMRDDHESHVFGGQGLFSPELSAESASVRSQPGILIFSRRRQLLHMNRRALELTGYLNQAEIGPDNEVHSAPVRELQAHIQETLDHRTEANIWEIFELKRCIFEAGRKILVRGFGLADRNSYDDSRIIIVLEEVGFRHTPVQGCASESRHSIVEEPAACDGHARHVGRSVPLGRSRQPVFREPHTSRTAPTG
jgi:PAS domain-containing protein